MKMNLPNKLTILRVCMIPFFVFFLMTDFLGGFGKYVATAIFVVASFTDMLDGKIARKYNLVTNFGKFMDPLADKLLVCSALICFIELGRISSIIVLIIIARDFIISGFRLVAADKGVVIAAGYWGKLKTVVQMIMIVVVLLDIPFAPFEILEQVLIWAALILTIVSLVDYLIKNKEVLRED